MEPIEVLNKKTVQTGSNVEVTYGELSTGDYFIVSHDDTSTINLFDENPAILYDNTTDTYDEAWEDAHTQGAYVKDMCEEYNDLINKIMDKEIKKENFIRYNVTIDEGDGNTRTEVVDVPEDITDEDELADYMSELFGDDVIDIDAGELIEESKEVKTESRENDIETRINTVKLWKQKVEDAVEAEDLEAIVDDILEFAEDIKDINFAGEDLYSGMSSVLDNGDAEARGPVTYVKSVKRDMQNILDDFIDNYEQAFEEESLEESVTIDNDVTNEFEFIKPFENNFGKIKIVKQGKEYLIYRDDAKSDEDYIDHGNKDYIEGWLHGAVKANNKVITPLSETIYCVGNSKLTEDIEDFKKPEEDNELPEWCYTYVESENIVGVVRRGIVGYYPSTADFSYLPEADRKEAMLAFIKEQNEILGVSEEEQRNMVIQSMFGWKNEKGETITESIDTDFTSGLYVKPQGDSFVIGHKDHDNIEAFVFGDDNIWSIHLDSEPSVIYTSEENAQSELNNLIKAIEENGIDSILKEAKLEEDYTETYRMTYKELKDYFRKINEEGKPAVDGVIVFTEGSFDKIYSLESRSYEVSSDNKAFQSGKLGYSIYGDSLDGTDIAVRLEGYMKEEQGGADGWVVDYCYLKEYKDKVYASDDKEKVEEDFDYDSYATIEDEGETERYKNKEAKEDQELRDQGMVVIDGDNPDSMAKRHSTALRAQQCMYKLEELESEIEETINNGTSESNEPYRNWYSEAIEHLMDYGFKVIKGTKELPLDTARNCLNYVRIFLHQLAMIKKNDIEKDFIEESKFKVTLNDVLDELECDIDSPMAQEEGPMIQEFIDNHPEATAVQIAEAYRNYEETGTFEIVE